MLEDTAGNSCITQALLSHNDIIDINDVTMSKKGIKTLCTLKSSFIHKLAIREITSVARVLR